MLVLARKPGEKVLIDNHIVVTVTEVCGGKVKIAIEAPDRVRILRGEQAIAREEPFFVDAEIDSKRGRELTARTCSPQQALWSNGSSFSHRPERKENVLRRLRQIPR